MKDDSAPKLESSGAYGVKHRMVIEATAVKEASAPKLESSGAYRVKTAPGLTMNHSLPSVLPEIIIMFYQNYVNFHEQGGLR